MSPTGTRPQLQYLHDAIEDLKAKHLYFNLRFWKASRSRSRISMARKSSTSARTIIWASPRIPSCAAPQSMPPENSASAPAQFAPLPEPCRCTWTWKSRSPNSRMWKPAWFFSPGSRRMRERSPPFWARKTWIISDELNHASIIDGCRLSRATIKVFKHKDTADCERVLQETKDWPGKKLLITDGVFSMDGDIANLPALCDLAEKYNCIMMVDDAHSSGVLGQKRPRHRGSSQLPRTRRYSGGYAQQGSRLDWRLRLRFKRPDSFSVPARAAVSFLHVASAIGDGDLPGGLRTA